MTKIKVCSLPPGAPGVRGGGEVSWEEAKSLQIPMPSKLPAVGDVLAGRYHITSVLGRGGFGTVYRAHQLSVGRDVALKCMAPEVAQDPNNVERFRREALHISQLRHPNTVTLYDYGQTDEGLFYIVLELVEGRSLASEIGASRGLGSERGLSIFLQICESLAEAHQHGIVHRDLKPENILLCEMHGERDYVKVLDFGLAKATSWSGLVETRLTAEGKVFGTPMYMAPEQVCGEEVTTATDVYALGLLFFEMLTGQVPVPGKTRLKVLRAQLNEPVPYLPEELASHGLGEVIRRCTAKEPGGRYPDAGALLEELREARPSGAPIAPGQGEAEAQPVGSTRETREVRPPRAAEAPSSPPSPHPSHPSYPVRSTRPTQEVVAVAEAGAAPAWPLQAEAASELDREASCREGELEGVVGWTQRLGSREGGRLLVCAGEPGAGKSRLLERWAARLGAAEASVRVAWGRGVCRAAGGHPLGAVREALRGALWEERAGWGEGEAWSGEAGEASRRFLSGEEVPVSPRLVAGLGRVLAWLASRRPAVLVLDDAEHAGAAVCGLIEHLLSTWSPEAAPVGWVLSGRAEGLVHNPEVRGLRERLAGREVVELRLERLDRARCASFASSLLACDAEAQERLFALSQGTPMFVVQILRFWLGSGQLRRGEDGLWRLASRGAGEAVPQDLLELLRLRIEGVVDRHPERPGLKVLLQWLALLGMRTPVGLVAAAMGLGRGGEASHRLGEDLGVLERAGLVRRQGSEAVEFDHVLLREALLVEVAKLRVAPRWHLRAAGALLDWASREGSAPPYLEIARHYQRAGDEGAWRGFLMRAGEQARAALERRQAREIYQEVERSLAVEDPQRVEILGALGELCESLGELGPAEDYYRLGAAAAARHGQASAEVRGLRGRARVLLMQHRVASARPLAEEACALARAQGDATALVEGLDVLAEVASRSGDVESCEASLAEASRRLGEVVDPRVRGRLWLRQAEVRRRSGERSEHVAWLQRALREFEEGGDLQGRSDALAALGFHLVERGEVERASAHLEKALEIKEVIADRQGVAQVLSHLGLNAMRRGELRRAEELLGRSVASFRAMGADYHVANALINLGLLLGQQRRYGEADACYEEALGRLLAVGDRATASQCMTNRGVLALNRGELDAARWLFREARRMKQEAGTSWGMAGVMANLAFVAAWDGELEAASRLYRGLLEGGTAPAEEAVIQALLGVLELYRGEASASVRIEAGWRAASSSGAPGVVALCRAALALLRAAQGRRGESAAILADVSVGEGLGVLEPGTWLRWLRALEEAVEASEGLVQGRLAQEARWGGR